MNRMNVFRQARGTLIHKKNQKSKISCQTPFKILLQCCRYFTKSATCLGGKEEQGEVLRALPQVLPRPRGKEQAVFPYITIVATHKFGCAILSRRRLFGH